MKKYALILLGVAGFGNLAYGWTTIVINQSNVPISVGRTEGINTISVRQFHPWTGPALDKVTDADFIKYGAKWNVDGGLCQTGFQLFTGEVTSWRDMYWPADDSLATRTFGLDCQNIGLIVDIDPNNGLAKVVKVANWVNIEPKKIGWRPRPGAAASVAAPAASAAPGQQ